MKDTKDNFEFLDDELKSKAEKLVKLSLEGVSETLLKSFELFKVLIPKLSQSKLTGNDFAKHLINLNIETTKIINEHGKKALTEIISMIENSGDIIPDKNGNLGGKEKGNELNVTGEIGKNVAVSFTITNSGEGILNAIIIPSDLENQDGEKISSKVIEIKPDKISLKPNTEAQIQINVLVDKKFTPDKIYTSALNINGAQSRQIFLRIHTIKSNEPSRKKKTVKKIKSK